MSASLPCMSYYVFNIYSLVVKLALAALLSTSLHCLAQVPTPHQITISSGEWSPYISPLLQGGGPFSQIVTESYALEGIETKYTYLSWTESMAVAKRGDVDGIIAWSFNTEREIFFQFSAPFANHHMAFAYRKESHYRWETLDDLKGITVAAVAGNYYGKDFQAAERAGMFKVVLTTTEQKVLEMLLDGRVDAAVSGHGVMMRIINRYLTPDEIASLELNTHILPSQELHMLLSRKTPWSDFYLESFNRGFEKLKASGRYEQILMGYEKSLMTNDQ